MALTPKVMKMKKKKKKKKKKEKKKKKKKKKRKSRTGTTHSWRASQRNQEYIDENVDPERREQVSNAVLGPTKSAAKRPRADAIQEPAIPPTSSTQASFTQLSYTSRKKITTGLRGYGTVEGVYNPLNFLGLAFFRKQVGVVTASVTALVAKKAKLAAAPSPVQDFEVSDIHLDGQIDNDVEIYDTCQEIRRKITTHLQKPGVTQASFLRHIGNQFYANSKKIQSKQLNDFRNKSGVDAGNTSFVFYGAYCYFEKLSIKEGKKKSKTREDMEIIWGQRGGVDVKHPSHYDVYVLKGDSFARDKYGRYVLNGRTHGVVPLPRDDFDY
ncbi:hypothetical protein M501DRAFT_1015218 [Patellaria atrata CBS 101060]|uniref:DUF7726 domain-containing protein n=1 Tax=Patellaria atrata CBS 101060 TaxID=1346257 RepID=A0A9P4SCH3_9PEZI|nr:hypothetical protein M501DRAFT_1015218 [Patellaria atrata CBS 101060]